MSIRRSRRPLALLGLPLLALAVTACGGPRPAGDPPPPELPHARIAPPDTSLVLPEPALPAPTATLRPHTVTSPAGDRVDPYYWLRDDTRSRADVLAHLRAERDYFEARFAPLAPLRQRLLDEMRARIKEDDSSVPRFEDGYWYYTRYQRGKQYPIYARRRGRQDGPEEVLFDANERAAGHAYYQALDVEVSENGRILAVAENVSGARKATLRFRDLARGTWLPDAIPDVAPNVVFANDDRTVFFVELDATLRPWRVKRHRLGQALARAETVYEENDAAFSSFLRRTKSDRYLAIDNWSVATTDTLLLSASEPEGEFRFYLPRERGHQYSVDDAGSRFVIRSNRDAPNFQLWSAPAAIPGDPSQFQPLLPHRADASLEDMEVFDDRVAVAERSDALARIRIVPLAGGESTLLAADEPVYVMGLDPSAHLDRGKLRYSYTSLGTPPSVYEFDFARGTRTLLKRDPVLGGFDPANYTTELRHAQARDGARIPVFLAYRKDTPRDGTAPLYQWGYGAYSLSRPPAFQAPLLSLLDRGFVFAHAAVRGGSELGRAWYEGGKLLAKRNSFNDFIDATDFLVRERYAAADKVFAVGKSAGGLLMGAVANQDPARYRGIVAREPFVDIVTTMLDESIPLTTGDYDEWGDPRQKTYYDYMLSYSPYDQVAAQAYPAMLVTTGLHDSQVQYFEPAKWVARLRAMKTDRNPLLFKVNLEAGHAGRSGRFERLEDKAEEYAFLLGLLGER